MSAPLGLIVWLSAASQSALFEPIPVTPGEGFCAEEKNMYNCAKAIEQRVLAEATHIVSRSDEKLCFALRERVCLVDDSELDTYAAHFYIGSLSDPYAHVVWVVGYEHHYVVLVDGDNGATTEMDDIPVPSPDGKWLAVASWDLVSGWVENGVSVWSVDDDAPKMVWSVSPRDWGPGPPEWQDSHNFTVGRIEERRREDGMMEFARTGTVHIERHESEWRIAPEREPE